MTEAKRKQAKTKDTTPLPGDAETLCAILARIVERIAETERPRRAPARV